MKALVETAWTVWRFALTIYDYVHTSAMEKRIQTLENTVATLQCVITLLIAGLVALFIYMHLRTP